MGIQFRKHRENEQEKIFLLKFMDYLIRIEAMIVLGTIPLLEIDFFSVLHHDALLIETQIKNDLSFSQTHTQTSNKQAFQKKLQSPKESIKIKAYSKVFLKIESKFDFINQQLSKVQQIWFLFLNFKIMNTNEQQLRENLGNLKIEQTINPSQEEQDNEIKVEKQVMALYPNKVLTGHWMTISRPQYKRTCGISSLVSLWNFQFSKLGMGNKDPISIEQAMLKLNLIGNGSVEQNMRKRFKKTAQLTEKTQQLNDQGSENPLFEEEKNQDAQIRNNKMTLDEYINTIDFGCFTGNDTLLKWYRLLCRIYGGSGRSYMFYKTNSSTSLHKTQQAAKKALIQGLNSNGKICFIYHAYDHYFCPVGYEFIPKDDQGEEDGTFSLDNLSKQGNELYVMIGQSSKMFPCMHVVKWSEVQLDLQTYWPKFFNIRRRKEGVQFYKGKQNQQSRGNTINCIMAFQKLKD